MNDLEFFENIISRHFKEQGISMDEFKNLVRELYFSQTRDNDNFSSLLFVLFQKADSNNYAKLKKGFPLEELVFRSWRTAKSEKQFFSFWLGNEYGIKDA
jgi:hypothetical protein